MLENSNTLIRFVIKRNKIRIPLWLIGITFFTWMIPVALDDMFPTQDERDVIAETMANPAMTAMVGPGDVENYTLGAMTTHNMFLFTTIVVGLMSILIVTRHTRTEEEDGLSELILGLPVGRLANLNAVLITLVIVNFVLAIVTAVGLYSLGLESMDLEGSLLYGASLGATGIFFTGMAAIFNQIVASGRGATGLSIAVLLLAYLIRAVGDVTNESLSLLSPLGLVTRTEVYSSNNWWPILLLLGFSIVLFLLANYLNAIRDGGAALFGERNGRKHASKFLGNSIGLVLRITRTASISWAIGLFVLGMSYGAVMGDLESFFQGNELLEEMLIAKEGYTLTEQFIPMLMLVMAILASIPPVMTMNRLIGEERKNRTEHVLATPVSRTKLMASYLLVAIINAFIMLSLTASGLWLAAEAVMVEGFSFGVIYRAALVYFPAVLVMLGLSVLLIGALPRFTSMIWLYIVTSFVINYFGGLLDFPEWGEMLTPFGYVPAVPVESVDWMTLIALSMTAILLFGLGFTGYKRRDITG